MKLTPEEAQRIDETQESIEWVVHPAMVPGLVAWLNTRGIDLVQGPPPEERPDALRWFVASPRMLQR